MLPLKKVSLQLWTFTMTVIHSLVFIYEKRENMHPKLVVQEMVCIKKRTFNNLIERVGDVVECWYTSQFYNLINATSSGATKIGGNRKI